MAKCAICRLDRDDVRIVIRDDYDQIRGTFPLNMTEDQRDRMYGLLDSLVDPLRRAECKACRMEINNTNEAWA